MVRIIISVETNLFAVEHPCLSYELISLICYLWIVSSEPEGMIPEKGILV